MATQKVTWTEYEKQMDLAEDLFNREKGYLKVHNALNVAKDLYKKIKKREADVKEAVKIKAKEEEISWDKWAELLKKLGIMLEREEDSKEVEDLINVTRAIRNKLRAADKKAEKKKPAKIAKEEATKITFEETGKSIGCLVAEKNVKYGDSFGKSGDLLRTLYPNGIKPEQYDDVLTVTRVLDKIFRIATDKDAFGESPWKDIAGYAILKVAASENEK